jgi:hypothetical protein
VRDDGITREYQRLMELCQSAVPAGVDSHMSALDTLDAQLRDIDAPDCALDITWPLVPKQEARFRLVRF